MSKDPAGPYPRKDELVLKEEDIQATYRLRVFGGWLVTVYQIDEDGGYIPRTSTFIPDPNGQWELESGGRNER